LVKYRALLASKSMHRSHMRAWGTLFALTTFVIVEKRCIAGNELNADELGCPSPRGAPTLRGRRAARAAASSDSRPKCAGPAWGPLMAGALSSAHLELPEVHSLALPPQLTAGGCGGGLTWSIIQTLGQAVVYFPGSPRVTTKSVRGTGGQFGAVMVASAAGLAGVLKPAASPLPAGRPRSANTRR
jgi:hypothetical protein